MNEQPKGTIISGYRILDLTDEKGMFCSRLLADMGADVIRIESPGGSSSHDYLNLGKRSISLDIQDERGSRVLKRLVETAAVLVESFSPGYLYKLGLGYTELSRINPRLVMASITGFGQNGPYKDYKSSDMVAGAMGGSMYVSGDVDTPPLKLYGSQSFYSAGLFAAIGVLLALRNRHTTGKGQHIDISLQECVAATLDHVLVRFLYEGVTAKRQGSLYWNNAFRIFPCCDGYILLSLFHQWETLVEWVDSEGMADDLTDNKWQDRETRLKHLDHIIKVLERWTLSHTVAELVEKGQLMRFPWAEVTTIPGLLASPQLNERNYFIDAVDRESGKRYKIPGAPVKLSRSPWHVGTYAPAHGEHNRDIYQGELGLSENEIKVLVRDGVI
ncbi:CaiB/BaiF CoA transferase family protein [Chloroflexota bacterium]